MNKLDLQLKELKILNCSHVMGVEISIHTSWKRTLKNFTYDSSNTNFHFIQNQILYTLLYSAKWAK